jgi:hypothetical protein
MTTANRVTAAELGLPENRILVNGGRSGRKVHVAQPGSSVLGCGKWVRHDVRHFQVSSAHVSALCEKCVSIYLTKIV